MKPEEWLDTRQERAEQRLREALCTGHLDLGTVHAAFREITDDPLTESAARLMAQALGVLPVEALLCLVSEAERAMRDLAEDAASRTQARLEKALAKLPAGADRRSVTVATIREASPYTSHGLVAFAATLQALTWAVTPPAPDARPLAY